jgi:hypothetical protein
VLDAPTEYVDDTAFGDLTLNPVQKLSTIIARFGKAK